MRKKLEEIWPKVMGLLSWLRLKPKRPKSRPNSRGPKSSMPIQNIVGARALKDKREEEIKEQLRHVFQKEKLKLTRQLESISSIWSSSQRTGQYMWAKEYSWSVKRHARRRN